MRPRGRSSRIVSGVVLALTLSSCLGWAQASAKRSKVDPDLQALADTERAFAKLGAEKGVRESFMQYFASDGIWFVPHPKATVADLASRPAPTAPPTRRLEWAPMYGDVSRAGDMGYDTGPSANSDLSAKKEPTRYGYFFSIWKKQPDGTWRVALDLGTQAPDVWDPAEPPEFTAAVPSGWKGKPSGDDKASLLAAEAAYSTAAKTSGLAKAAERFVESGARVYRNNVSPVIGRKAVLAFFAQKDSKSHWEPIEGFVASSADLGYTYGRYWSPALSESDKEDTGYYVHVWRRNAAGEWKLVFDVTSPADLIKK